MTGGFSAAAVRAEFPSLRGIVHLNSASMGAAPVPALAAVAGQLRLLEAGPRGGGWTDYVEEFEAPVERARAEARKLLHAREDEVGVILDTTSGLHHAIESIPFAEGDNVVLSDLEYPQVPLAARNAVRDPGIELRFVHHRAGRLSLDDYRAAVDGRTKAILLSSVCWVTGQRMDLAAFSELARENDLFLVVDAVQQLGGIDVDCSKLGADFLMAGGYKWLNAPFGCGVFYVRSETHERGLRVRRAGLLGLEAPPEGWSAYYGNPEMVPLPALDVAPTIRRFEAQGTPNRVGSAGLAASLGFRNALDPAAVDRHILTLSGALLEGIRARGARVFTPSDDASRAGIVTFTFGDGAAADEGLRAFLERRSIYVSKRWCSGVGGIRAAVHLFNVQDDVEAFLSAVDEFRRDRA